MSRDLNNRVVVITGASAGIGRETALEFARQNCRLVLASRREEPLRSVATEVQRYSIEALAVTTDISVKPQVERLIQEALTRFGRIDVLVNNAGFGVFARMEDTTEADIQELFATNFMGCVYTIWQILPVFRRQGEGHIINVTSLVGKRAIPGAGAYCASKAALNAVTESLRTELRGSGIDVSLVIPLSTQTAFFSRALNRNSRTTRPIGITQTASDVANAIVGCARSPRAEVYPFPAAKILSLASLLFPKLVDRYLDSLVKKAQQ